MAGAGRCVNDGEQNELSKKDKTSSHSMSLLNISDLDAIVFDFDGVLTDDHVYLDQDGREMVRCTRTDGIAFDILRETTLKLFILTTEKNPIVIHRAAKLKVPVLPAVRNKLEALKKLAYEEGFTLARTLYVGNDVNDFFVMKACGFSACPGDAHPQIRKVARFVLEKAGGEGVAREVVEQLLGLDALEEWHTTKRADDT